MWDEAIARAKRLDSLPEPVGPLHGLPISVKEHHGMNGKTNHASYVAWIGNPSERNPINEVLYGAGCVYYVRTTGPQTLMHLECNNNIYGRTLNPYNRNLTCGGSSGGEGALVGMRGSVWVGGHRAPYFQHSQISRLTVHRVSGAISEAVFVLLRATAEYMASNLQPSASLSRE